MKSSEAMARLLASLIFLLVLTTTAQAQSYRTWVAGSGNDANPCTYALPCQTYARAITQTTAGGEINTESAGEFGPVTIDKSITIDGGGAFSGILAGSTAGGGVIGVVTIDDSATATPSTAVVTLRNLSNVAGLVYLIII